MTSLSHLVARFSFARAGEPAINSERAHTMTVNTIANGRSAKAITPSVRPRVASRKATPFTIPCASIEGEPPASEWWARFVQSYTPLLMHVVRISSRDHDEAMDAYLFILERLQENDFRRLRAFSQKDGTAFTTWLCVVAKRLCIDRHRTLYGRLRVTGGGRANHTAIVRQHIVDLDGQLEKPDLIPDEDSENASAALERSELERGLRSARATLSPSDRLLLDLRFERNMSGRQIAQALNYPTPYHAYRRLGFVLRELKDRLEKRGF